MLLRIDPVGAVYPTVPAYHYQCDGCTSLYTFDAPQDAPFRCHSASCGWSMVSVCGERTGGPNPGPVAPCSGDLTLAIPRQVYERWAATYPGAADALERWIADEALDPRGTPHVHAQPLLPPWTNACLMGG